MNSSRNNIVDKFNLWKVALGHENLYAKDDDIPVESFFNLSDTSLIDEIRKIENLAQKNEVSSSEETSWQFQENSYNSHIEAHFQFLIMWAFEKACNYHKIPIDLSKPFPILIRSIKSNSFAPFVVSHEDCYFIIIPSSFLRILNCYLTSYFELVCLGKKEKTRQTNAKIKTDYIGGEYAETAIKSDIKKANGCLGEIIGYISGAEVFHDLIHFDYDFEKNGYPLWFVDFTKNALKQVSNEFGMVSPGGKSDLSENAPYFVYATTTYVILHEISHIILGHLEDGGNRNFSEERSADELAYLLYVEYCNSRIPRQKNTANEVLKFCCGPLLYIEIFEFIELIKMQFYFSREDLRMRFYNSYFEIKKRGLNLHKLIRKAIKGAEFTDQERAIVDELINEYQVLEVFAIMTGSQIINKKVISFNEAFVHSNSDQVFIKVFP